jgi:hypothetical protein
MSDPSVCVQIDSDRRAYQPGEVLSGSFRLDAVAGREVGSVEVSVLWCTEGKGDEDMGVHQLEVLTPGEGGFDPADWRRFSVCLPRSPLSYEGLIVKVRWCVRVRARIAGWSDRVAEARFRLGDVTAPGGDAYPAG